ncbi:hypothetical protein [Bradyrhizobium sp. ERR14]|uniref:AbiTii domain-containing protein n=1 Tax=Bradyrhizobium sp. ERR14 TaxID=2663837 RepID=UPI0016083DB0|nr:hypothetical protein [Bradyrhizobium sp. ERR14]MBB4391796.1 hypothetical protein [Bradyrhizobium sp. ERR14]
MSDRIDEARQVARTLLNDLETVTVRTEGVLMKAKRLARLMRDSDAQLWLEYETSGYPSEHFNPTDLGTCERYVRQSGRIDPTGKYWIASLPQIEAIGEGYKQRAEAMVGTVDKSVVVENYLVKRATEEFLANQTQQQIAARKLYNDNEALAVALRASIHSYATDVFLAIELGDAAQDIFEEARKRIDNFVRSHAPKAAEQLVAVNERMAEGSLESYSHALTTCRRLLLTVADALFPARSQPYTDKSGKPRVVGSENYKNRLMAFVEENAASEGSTVLIQSGLEHLAARLDAVNAKVSKGVHTDVTQEEARLAVIHTYLFLGEVARASKTSTVPLRS